MFLNFLYPASKLGGRVMKVESSRKLFRLRKKERVTKYSRDNMSCDCIITSRTIDVTVTGEIAIAASSVMDLSMIANMEMVKRPSSLILTDWKQTAEI